MNLSKLGNTKEEVAARLILAGGVFIILWLSGLGLFIWVTPEPVDRQSETGTERSVEESQDGWHAWDLLKPAIVALGTLVFLAVGFTVIAIGLIRILQIDAEEKRGSQRPPGIDKPAS